jgi:hypothetical protein
MIIPLSSNTFLPFSQWVIPKSCDCTYKKGCKGKLLAACYRQMAYGI